MKGKNTLKDKPFRYGGILKDYSKEIHELNGHEYKCWCCGRDMKSHVPGIKIMPYTAILDVTCGSRTIWFNKHNPAAIYCDIRKEELTGIWKLESGQSERTCIVDPDIQCDFTSLPFADGTFSLVVFDPPHLKYAGATGWLAKKYGRLDEHWPEMLHDGFQECMRVLKENGVLIFKWAETDIPAQKVWKAIGQKPLFGHHSGKRSNTFWACFMKGVV